MRMIPRQHSPMMLGTPTHGSSTFDEAGARRFATPPTTPIASWRKSPVSSIFKPRRHGGGAQQQNHHPSHLCVPMLGSAATESFMDSSWVNNNNDGHLHQQQYPSQQQYPPQRQYSQQQYQQHPYQQQHFTPPYPQPPPTRSPRTIRFIDEQLESSASPSTTVPLFHLRVDDAVEITPNSAQPADRKQLSSPDYNYKGTVSRRGRRPALISRHASH